MVDQTYALASNGVYGQQNGVYTDLLDVIIENFEDGSLEHWVGTEPSVSATTNSIFGTYSLIHDGSSFVKLTSGPGVTNPLPEYPAKGAEMSWIVDTDAMSSAFWLVAYGSSDGTSTSNYNIHIRVNSGDFELKEEVGGTESTLTSSAGVISSNTIYEFTLQWHDGTDNTNNTATATCYNYDVTNQERGSEVASLNAAVDSSHDTNNNGTVELWFSGDSNQAERVDNITIIGGGPTI